MAYRMIVILCLLPVVFACRTSKGAEPADSSLPFFTWGLIEDERLRGWTIEAPEISMAPDKDQAFTIVTKSGQVIRRSGWMEKSALFLSKDAKLSDPPVYLLKDLKRVAKAKPTVEKPAGDEKPGWTDIVLDEKFSDKGKVWEVAQRVYKQGKAFGLGTSNPEDVVGIDAGIANAGLTVEEFRNKYGEGKLVKSDKGNDSGVTYYFHGPIGFGFKPGVKTFSWLKAPARIFSDGFVIAAKKVKDTAEEKKPHSDADQKPKPSVEVLSCELMDNVSEFGASGTDLIVRSTSAPQGKKFCVVSFKLSSPLKLEPLPDEFRTWLKKNKSYPLAEAQQREAEFVALRKKYAKEFDQRQSFIRRLWPVARDRQGDTYKSETATFVLDDSGLADFITQGSATFIVSKDASGLVLEVPGHLPVNLNIKR